MTTNKTNTSPIATVRDGAIKAAIWKNTGESGPFYSVRFTRTWQDAEGQYHDSDTLTGTEILQLGHLAGRVYDRVAELRQADRDEQKAQKA